MKNNQAGGIVSFVVIGLVLAGLLGGGLYFSKQQARQARDNDTTAPQVTINETSTESGADDKGSDAPATTAPKETPKPAAPAPQPQNQTAAPKPAPTTGATNRVATTGPSDAIPATGPKETTAAFVVLGILTFASYRFIDARRGFIHSALRR